MKDYLREDGIIPLEEILEALNREELDEMAIGRELLVHHHSRIVPTPIINQFGKPLVRYYLKCIQGCNRRSDSDLVHSPFEAAGELQRLFELWVSSKTKYTSEYIIKLVDDVTDAYRQGNDKIRYVLETGFLEHVFEIKENRSFFAHWIWPPFRDAFLECSKWGDAHPRQLDRNGGQVELDETEF